MGKRPFTVESLGDRMSGLESQLVEPPNGPGGAPVSATPAANEPPQALAASRDHAGTPAKTPSSQAAGIDRDRKLTFGAMLIATIPVIVPAYPIIATLISFLVYTAYSITNATPFLALTLESYAAFVLLMSLLPPLIVCVLASLVIASVAYWAGVAPSIGTWEQLLAHHRELQARLESRGNSPRHEHGSSPEDPDAPPISSESRDLALKLATAALCELHSHLARPASILSRDPGFGFLWTLVHRADAALLSVEPSQSLARVGHADRLRLVSSQVPEKALFIKHLDRALPDLESGLATYAIGPPDLANGTRGDAKGGSHETSIVPLKVDDSAKRAARAAVCQIHRDVEEFETGRAVGLVRAQRTTLTAATSSGLATYVLVLLAIIGDVPYPLVLVAAAYFVVGALVGLVNLLYHHSRTRWVGEDFGLWSARLLLSPLLSGLAAIAGVLVTAMLTLALNTTVGFSGAPVNAQPPPVSATFAAEQYQRLWAEADAKANEATTIAKTAASAADAEGARSEALSARADADYWDHWARYEQLTATSQLGRIFSLDRYPFGLVLAAVFGLVPGMLLSTLTKQAEHLQEELNSTRPSSSS